MKLIRSLYVPYLCGRNLENRLASRPRGFESHRLRHPKPLKLLRFKGFLLFIDITDGINKDIILVFAIVRLTAELLVTLLLLAMRCQLFLYLFEKRQCTKNGYTLGVFLRNSRPRYVLLQLSMSAKSFTSPSLIRTGKGYFFTLNSVVYTLLTI